jgi:predicted nucleic acid-binding Zn ribbon protein
MVRREKVEKRKLQRRITIELKAAGFYTTDVTRWHIARTTKYTLEV